LLASATVCSFTYISMDAPGSSLQMSDGLSPLLVIVKLGTWLIFLDMLQVSYFSHCNCKPPASTGTLSIH